MRPLGVVVVGPLRKDQAGFVDREERRLFEQLVAHAAVKVVHEPILRRLT